MATFIRQGKAARSANPTTALVKQAQLYIAQNTDPKTGKVTDPSVYGKALQMLKGNNTPAALKAAADIQNSQSALTGKLNNAYATKGMIDYEFKNAQYNIGKTYALNPAQLISHMYGLYDFHATQIENHVKELQSEGQDATALQAYGATITDEATQYEKLFSAISGPQGFNSPQAKQAAQRFGMAVGTDSDGKITSFALHVVPSGLQDARMTQNGTTYVRTNSTYGGLPLYVVPQSDPNDATGNTYTAKIGNLQFSGTKKSVGQDALTLTDNRSFLTKIGNTVPDFFERVFGKRPESQGAGGSYHGMAGTVAGGVPTSGDKAVAAAQGAKVGPGYSVDLLGHIKPDDFSNLTSLPAGTIATDAAGNYHYINDQGQVFSAPNADIMSKNIDIPAAQIKSAALPLSSQDLELLNSQQDPNQRANAWMADPTENSPLNQSSPTSILQNTNQGVALATPSAPPGGVAAPAAAPTAPAMPTTKGKQPGIQQPSGQEAQQTTTNQIASGSSNLPNAGQAPAVA